MKDNSQFMKFCYKSGVNNEFKVLTQQVEHLAQ